MHDASNKDRNLRAPEKQEQDVKNDTKPPAPVRSKGTKLGELARPSNE